MHGKVVLIDFWTYTCINWRRTLPYIQAWESKYGKQGLVVIGVHTPEFSFEYNQTNVSSAMRSMNIGYPVALDAEYKVWNSFQNNYWPAIFLLDTKGQLRYQKFGEGDYQESELKIQQLLKEATGKNITDPPLALRPDGFEAAADWNHVKSPENFIGYERNEGFTSPGGPVADRPAHYSIPPKMRLNQWAISGEWVMGKENVRLNRGTGKVIYQFHARDLNLIMSPAVQGTTIKYRVLIDGNPPGPAHGLDIDASGNGVLTEPRMYQLVRQPGTIADHEFQIEFFDPGAEVFDFTFG